MPFQPSRTVPFGKPLALTMLGLLVTACSGGELDASDSGDTPSVDIVEAMPSFEERRDMAFSDSSVQDTLCQLMRTAAAGTGAEATEATTDCAVRTQGDNALVKVGNGPSLRVNYVELGDRVAASPDDGWNNTQPGSMTGFQRNLTAAYIVEGVEGALCADIDYSAADGTSDSGFVTSAPGFSKTQINFPQTPNASGKHRFEVAEASSSVDRHFVVFSPREAGLEISGMTFVSCG